MDFSVIEKVVKAFVPNLSEIIPSTMGEPFLYSHFENFLELAKLFNLKVNITTNGTFANGGVERWSPLILPVLSDIKFSAMHGKIPQWLRKNISDFAKKRDVSKFKPTISIQATIGEGDKLDEVPNEVNRVKINEIWRIGSTAGVMPPSRSCQFLGKKAWVWVDGTFQVCPNPDARFGMRSKIPFGDFGNFANQNPIEIWQGEKYKQFCENYRENNICKRCKMRG
ncbi:hypothetical protein AGMMS49938_14930 [Fibrobacterales bacterium]|nr:hypothetical protein AGMMS49938_14930 [Fibrobacterales bacterium]